MIILFGVEMALKGQLPSPTLTLVGADPGNGALDTRHRHLNFSRGMSRHSNSFRPPGPPIVCLFTNWAMCYGPVKIKPGFTQSTPIACCIDMLPLWLKQSVTLNITFYYMLMQGIVCLSACSPETEGLRFCLNWDT